MDPPFTTSKIINNLPILHFEVSHSSFLPHIPSAPPYYVQSVSKKSITYLSLMGGSSSQLTLENHPFSTDLLSLSLGLKLFYNQVLSAEGDIFAKCTASSSNYRLFLFEAVHGIVARVERHTILNIMMEIISEVTGDIASAGIQINWLD